MRPSRCRRRRSLVGDFNGDHRADLVERQLSTGLLWVRLNPGTDGPTAFAYANGGNAVGRTMYGPDWRTVIGDFTGDGRAEFVDQYRPSGQFWVHRNIAGGDATMLYIKTTNWGAGQPTGGTSWHTIFGDFNGDGYTDFADLYEPTGQFWMHLNLANGGFTPPGQSWGSIGMAAPGTDWEILGSR
jgi:hypothetical protein